MQDTRFWRFVAVVVCVGLFYVGHGLHNRGSHGLPSLENVAHAGGVTVYNSRGAINDYHIYTTDQTGTLLHVWRADSSGKPKYVGVAQQNIPFLEARKTDAPTPAELRQRERQREAERVLIDPTKAGFKPRTQTDK